MEPVRIGCFYLLFIENASIFDIFDASKKVCEFFAKPLDS